ncbi:uncharacterized protein CC84DRAFT_1159426 [Paraphaeosphaeria sporulosa]|uniref:Uncharacterized protein n=1 Tax=Paraphaeosphaeria sporulosa TaxID=1460663 RepID=A0A177CZD5_9PLEO|nr:uncharacterized protein CC84DRAFT_1159426 [Paraphaeosphaeria sporulosa]OAG12039.1 hypothetical protein CC84DRAFT_1159426 [Paraphaeosphaeria sporulosa]
MTTPNAQSDMAQFFDFGEASSIFQELGSPLPSRPASRVSKHRVGCPAYGQEDDEGCLCASFNQDVSLPDALHDDIVPEEEFNTDFSSWLPRYQKAPHPCDYCRLKSLECFMYDVGKGKSSGCSPCNALFRPCSFTNPEKMPMQMKRTALDTLHSVAEVSERTFGGFTGKKPMRSLGHQGPIEEGEADGQGPKKGAAAARFPRAATKILKDWMIAHIDHPYPTEEEKEALGQQTGLSLGQISNWMANTRRRHKARPKRTSSPSLRPVTEPVNVPPGRTWESLNPFERWKHSPPENEPAPLLAIARNVETFDFPNDGDRSNASSYRKENSNDSTGSFSVFRAPSITSLDTVPTILSSGSIGSSTSATYSQSSRHSLGSFNSLKSKERRRRRRMPTRTPKHDAESDTRLFQCTFCTDRFKNKYDWTRHEKTLHLSLEKWICAPLGDVITCSSSGQRKCVFCDEINPSDAHLESHNHRACEEKGMEARTFYRKDHLRQHLRLMHGCKMTPSMEAWKAEAQVINSRCGFCAKTFEKWQDRCDHLAKEFRNGATMKNWKGCRGFDPHVAQYVTNAMPPYLIANESKSPFPFSASNSSSMKHPSMDLGQTDLEVLLPNGNDISPKTSSFTVNNSSRSGTTQQPSPYTTSPKSPHPYATCWEILTLRLGQFARESMERNGPGSVTDAMLQSEARRILYDTDDAWEQTAADNPEWLNLFRKAHGMDLTQPKAIAGHYSSHEVLEDLGLTPNAQLDQSFDLNNFHCITKRFSDPVARARAFECTLAGSMAISKAGEMSVPITHMPGLTTSATTSGASNLPIPSFPDFGNSNVATDDLEGTGAGGFCIGSDGEFHATSAPLSKSYAAFMTPIKEMSCNAAGEAIEPSYGFPAFTTAEFDFDMATTTAGLGANLTATSGFGDFDVSAGTTMDNSQMLPWDDSDLTFNMDMDMDMDLGMPATSGA